MKASRLRLPQLDVTQLVSIVLLKRAIDALEITTNITRRRTKMTKEKLYEAMAADLLLLELEAGLKLLNDEEETTEDVEGGRA